MCRLMMFNRQFALEHNETELADIFNRLNSIQGGHGMGIFLSGDTPKLVKGVKIKGKRLAKEVYRSLVSNKPFDYGLFHCRLAGPAGSICDENSQPYYDVDTDICLAHNGVAYELCNSKYDYSDTELLLKIMAEYGIPHKNLEYFSGVFIGTNKGVPFVVKGAEWTDLHLLYHEETGAWCFISVPLYPFNRSPYRTVRIKKAVWQGHNVDQIYVDALATQYRSYPVQRFVDGKWVEEDTGLVNETFTPYIPRTSAISSMTDKEWNEWEAEHDRQVDEHLENLGE